MGYVALTKRAFPASGAFDATSPRARFRGRLAVVGDDWCAPHDCRRSTARAVSRKPVRSRPGAGVSGQSLSLRGDRRRHPGRRDRQSGARHPLPTPKRRHYAPVAPRASLFHRRSPHTSTLNWFSDSQSNSTPWPGRLGATAQPSQISSGSFRNRWRLKPWTSRNEALGTAASRWTCRS